MAYLFLYSTSLLPMEGFVPPLGLGSPRTYPPLKLRRAGHTLIEDPP